QMRLLYVALTRAEKKLYQVGKGNADNLAKKYDGKKADGVLAQTTRESVATFKDWIIAIDESYSGEDLHFKKVFVTDEDLT
ncbi:hypothetical protein ACJBSX_10995, partial [Streptococcus suis]